MKKIIFKGCGTAIVTPFTENGVNFEEFGRLIEDQISNKVDAIIVCGTTGESSTMTLEERKQTIKFDTPPCITDVASIVGPKEAEGPLEKYFDQCLEDEFWGEKTWEKSESKIIKETVNMAISKSF